MISKLDDYPIHQIPEPVAYTASSDRFTYDRFWYNGHDREGRYYFGIGMARYPNLGILDCGFSLVIDGRQYAFHGSRRAPAEPAETAIGPFDLQILEPMGRHRLVISPNDTGIECDLVFTPYTGAIQEGRQMLRNERYITMDATRIDQFGVWQGIIKYEGQSLEINAANTIGLKDRSWGIRPCGEAYRGGAPLTHFEPVHFMWLPIHWEEECTLAGLFENGDGYQFHTDQAITPIHRQALQEGAAAPVLNDPETLIWQGRVGHQVEFISGTRTAKQATFRMNDKNGDFLELHLEPLLLFRMKGIGYMHPQWAHGKWHGELAIAGESWRVDEVDPLAMENMHIQQVVRAKRGRHTGYGVLEQAHIGPYKSYGMMDWFDGAK